MRIVAGELGGRRIAAPPGQATRPTSDRAREALFSRLGSLDGERVLDLFAGSGALGLEALSRGAARATFCDSDRAATRILRANIASLGVGERADVHLGDFRRVLRERAEAGARFELVFLDPPYAALSGYSAALNELLPPVLAASARIVVESSDGTALSIGVPLGPPRRTGGTLIQILCHDQR